MFEDDEVYQRVLMIDFLSIFLSYDEMLQLVVLKQKNHSMLNPEYDLESFVLGQLMYCLVMLVVNSYKLSLDFYNDLFHTIHSNLH